MNLTDMLHVYTTSGKVENQVIIRIPLTFIKYFLDIVDKYA